MNGGVLKSVWRVCGISTASGSTTPSDPVFSFKRVLKPQGTMTILTARTTEFEKSAGANGVKILASLHTLVNGKKASLYRCSF